jgi:hypothetical protein
VKMMPQEEHSVAVSKENDLRVNYPGVGPTQRKIACRLRAGSRARLGRIRACERHIADHWEVNLKPLPEHAENSGMADNQTI